MARDSYSWNVLGSTERLAIENFLCEVERWAANDPERLPLEAREAAGSIKWLRDLLNRKPSDMAVS